jgi:hypothetical protein
MGLFEEPHAGQSPGERIEPGATLSDWKGVRVSLKVMDRATSGPVFENPRNEIARMKGKAAANIIDAAGRSELTEVRP